MTIQEAIDRVDALKPNKYSDEQKKEWMSELDGMIHKELILTHEGEEEKTFDGYNSETPMNTQLLVPYPYCEIYQHYISSQIDLGNAELDKYNNDKTLYNNAYMTYAAYYNRTHMPKSNVREIRI